MRALDLPPVWTILAILSAWALARFEPPGWSFGLPDLRGALSGLLIGGAVVLAGLAVAAMRQARTTVHPGHEPSALVTQGPFGWSRNPIYLAMALLCLGIVLRLDAPLALMVPPVLGAVLAKRFIRPEEARLAARFGPAWDAYAARVRRWL